jgi:heme exporter protein B
MVSEFRTRYAFNAVIMFSLVTLTVVSFSLGINRPGFEVMAALFWIILFFAAASGLAQVFIKEEEAHTAGYLRLYAPATAVLIGKIVFNLFLLVCMTVLLVPLFIVLLNTAPQNLALFLIGLLLGIIGLAGATTIIAAIVSRASIKGALFAVLSFPVLLPLLVAAIEITLVSFSGGNFAATSSALQLLIAYDVVMITLSILLFDFVWRL